MNIQAPVANTSFIHFWLRIGLVSIAVGGLLFAVACNITDTSGTQIDDTDVNDGDATASPDAENGDTSCEGITCSGVGECVIVDGSAVCQCDDGYELDGETECVATVETICEGACTEEPNRGQCVVDDQAQGTYHCDCDENYALNEETDQCVRTSCGQEEVRSGVTVYDMTPLPEVNDPIGDGYDPLLPGDTVRVVTEVVRHEGQAVLHLSVVTHHMDIHEGTLRLDGELIGDEALDGPRRIEIELPEDFQKGRLAFDATIPDSDAPMTGVDARLFTEGCEIEGSASGARLHLAGVINPKTEACADMSDVRSLQISTAIPDKNTSTYEQRNGTFEEISSAYKVLTQMSLCLRRSDDRTVSIAGSADGTRPWTIDNFLLIEVFDGAPDLPTSERTAAYITSSSNATAPTSYTDGSPIEVVKHATLPGDYTGSRTPSRFTFAAGVLQLDDLLPVGELVWLRITGLDEGVAGHLSRLFITSAEPDEFVPECNNALDCPAPDSASGSSSVMASGCIDGQCIAVSCSNDSDCNVGQRCDQGFCTDRCSEDSDCPTGLICGQGYCVDPAEGGCRDFSDCPLGEVCFFGQCQAGCYHPVNQDPTYSSNYFQYSLCTESPEACPRCPDPDTRCWYNYCRDCEIDDHCGTGEICADFECVPQ